MVKIRTARLYLSRQTSVGPAFAILPGGKLTGRLRSLLPKELGTINYNHIQISPDLK